MTTSVHILVSDFQTSLWAEFPLWTKYVFIFSFFMNVKQSEIQWLRLRTMFELAKTERLWTPGEPKWT